MNISFNVSEVAKNLSGGLTQQFYGRQDFVMTTQDLLDVCGQFDTAAVIVASIGLVCSLGFLFYLRRWREECTEEQRVFIDKATLSFIALCFAIVIVKLVRAG